MNDVPRPPDDTGDDDTDTGEPIAELAGFSSDVSTGFVARVRHSIERRSAAGGLLSAAWNIPVVVFLEFLSFVFEFFHGGSHDKGER